MIIGVLFGLLVAAAGTGYALVHPPTWAAERSVVIVPDSDDPTQQAALYDSLSHGQIAATAAEIYGQYRWHSNTPDVVVNAGVVPPSAVLEITATGTDKAVVERTLTEVLADATANVNEALVPYRAELLNTSQIFAHTTGLSTRAWIGISAFAGLFAGVLAVAGLNALRVRTGAGRRNGAPTRKSQLR